MYTIGLISLFDDIIIIIMGKPLLINGMDSTKVCPQWNGICRCKLEANYSDAVMAMSSGGIEFIIAILDETHIHTQTQFTFRVSHA